MTTKKKKTFERKKTLFWENVSHEEHQNLIDTVHKRLKVVIKTKGDITQF